VPLGDRKFGKGNVDKPDRTPNIFRVRRYLNSNYILELLSFTVFEWRPHKERIDWPNGLSIYGDRYAPPKEVAEYSSEASIEAFFDS